MNAKTLLTTAIAVALVVPLAGQNAKVLKAPRPSAPVECAMEGEIQTAPDSTVRVGRDTVTYGPTDQELYIHKSLLPATNPDGVPGDPVGVLTLAGFDGEYWGPYFGQIRVLNDRLDYFFDTWKSTCLQDNAATNLCPFRLTVVDGVPVYEKIGKTRVLTHIAFNEGRYLLDYRPCDPAVDPDNCYFKLLGCYDDRDCPGVTPGDPAYYIYAALQVLF